MLIEIRVLAWDRQRNVEANSFFFISILSEGCRFNSVEILKLVEINNDP
jgi:hypothetical protein